jgi:methionyl-tRNA formyltransferase
VSRIRALFLGTPDIARFCLEAMIKDEHFEVVGVVTQPDRLAQLTALKAEIVVVVAFGQILKQNFLDLFPQRVVNVHASLLPRWRGAAPMQRALMSGDKESGVSLQVMVRKLDAGPILGERRIPLDLDTNAADLYQQCQELGAQLIAVDLMDYLRGHLTPQPQDESQVTLAPKIEKSESTIDWRRSAVEIHNQVRGLVLGPVAQTRRQGKILKIHRTHPLETHSASLRPGQVLSTSEKSLIVQCGKGSLDLLEVQPESRAKMPLAEYLRGYPVKAGDVFGESQ